MKQAKKYIIANWKSNKDTSEIITWFKSVSQLFIERKLKNLADFEIVICSTYIHIPLVKQQITSYQLPFKVGAQDISPYSNGAYTGEVSAIMVSEFAEYVIIGHSERRIYFHEDEDMLREKTQMGFSAGLKTIFCVSNNKAEIPPDVTIIAYEPIWAIGTGKTETPLNANEVARKIKNDNKVHIVIYGGSVNKDNICNFLTEKEIDGVLPGNASLDPNSFWEMIVNAASN